MNKWKNTTIKVKLLLVFLLIGSVSIFVVGWQSYSTAKGSLEQSAFDQLIAIRATKSRQVESYFNQIRNQILTFSEDRMIIDAMKEFKAAFHNVLNEKGVKASKIRQYESSVRSYYNSEYLTRLNPNLDTNKGVDEYWPGEDKTTYLQYHYLSNNLNPTGSKDNLEKADDGSRYSDLHGKYHPIIRDYLKKFGYYDIFLVDDKTGHIVYTVFKEVDYTTSLLTGPYSNTNFAEAFRAAKTAGNKDFVKLVDFKPYDPSYAAPASFIASPIFEGNERIGVLLFQMPIDEINKVMTGNQNWRDDGLGESGETYLVGEDFTMRSISRFLVEDPENYYKALQDAGFADKLVDKIDKLQTSILLQEVKTDAAKMAFKGQAGEDIINDYREIPVLSSYAPLDIEDVDWIILSEIDEEEAFAPVSSLARSIFIWGFLIAAAIAGFAWWLAGSFANPIRNITEVAKTIATGDLGHDIEIYQEDEIGQLAQAFREMGDALKAKADVAVQIAEGNLDTKIEVGSKADGRATCGSI